MQRTACGFCFLPGFLLLALLSLSPASISSAAVYTLTVQTEGSGSVTRNPTNSFYPDGAVVTVTAAPGQDWYFREWKGDESSTANPLNVAMTGNKTLTAVFEPIPTYELTTAVQGLGVVTLEPPTGPYLSNSLVTATASAADGWVFVHWAGDTGGDGNPLAVAMSTNKSLQAVFAQLPAITGSPENVTAEIGDNVSFSAQAVGTAPLFFQWWFGYVPIDGATNETLSLTDIQSTQEGAYSVVVTNAYGAVTNGVVLTITDGCSGTNVVNVASEAALREAIQTGGVVRLCFNGTVTLSSTIEITHDVALDARDRTVLISGNNSVRLFRISPGATFSATNVVFANGRHVGQDGTNAGASVEEPAFPGLPGEGGAFLNDGGTVRLISCTLSNNSVIGGKGGSGSGTHTNALSGEGRGGAILVRGGSLLLDSVTIVSNSAYGSPMPDSTIDMMRVAGDALGGAVYITNGTAFVTDCQLRSNLCHASVSVIQAKALGGAFFMSSSAVTFSKTSLAANAAVGEASPVSFIGFFRPGAAYGGAIAASSGTLELARCEVRTNAAIGGKAYRHSGTGEAQGGGVFSSANLHASDSSFFQNRALSGSESSENTDGRGGGLHNAGSAVIERCTFAANEAVGGNAGSVGGPGASWPAGHGLGGGICNSSNLAVTNCTFSSNVARGGDATRNLIGLGPLHGSGIGGGLFNTNGIFHGVNVTFAGNHAVGGFSYNAETYGFAAGANVANAAGTLGLLNSLLADPGTNSNAWGIISDAGYNMSSDGSAAFNSGSSFNFTDPRLLPLADNGGLTLTMALATNSPAIDFGTTLVAPGTDQRGFARPDGTGVDIGAYELQTTASSVPSLALTSTGASLQLSFKAAPNVTYELQGSGDCTTWTDLELIGPFAEETMIQRPVSPDAGSEFFRLVLH